jgi:hypothetical protein
MIVVFLVILYSILLAALVVREIHQKPERQRVYPHH